MLGSQGSTLESQPTCWIRPGSPPVVWGWPQRDLPWTDWMFGGADDGAPPSGCLFAYQQLLFSVGSGSESSARSPFVGLAKKPFLETTFLNTWLPQSS